ncbi:MAG: signal peptidase I [Candidatus Aenigmatarchaeota archaeon]
MLKKIKMNETVETILYCFLGLLIAVSLNRGLALALGTSLPVVTVSSKSMVPTLKVGDIAVIYGREEYQLEDIIVFDGWEKEPIIHRIVGVVERKDKETIVEKDKRLDLSEKELKNYGEDFFSKNNISKFYITKGDGNRRCDQCYGYSPVLEPKIHGKSVVVIPYLGWVKLLAFQYIIYNPIGLGVVGILVGLFILYKLM